MVSRLAVEMGEARGRMPTESISTRRSHVMYIDMAPAGYTDGIGFLPCSKTGETF